MVNISGLDLHLGLWPGSCLTARIRHGELVQSRPRWPGRALDDTYSLLTRSSPRDPRCR